MFNTLKDYNGALTGERLSVRFARKAGAYRPLSASSGSLHAQRPSVATGRVAALWGYAPALLQGRARKAQMANRLSPLLDDSQGSGHNPFLTFRLPKLERQVA